MISYLTMLIRRTGYESIDVDYLNKAEGEGAWCHGQLVSIDAQGATFIRSDGGHSVAECLPWSSLAAIRVGLTTDEHDQRT